MDKVEGLSNSTQDDKAVFHSLSKTDKDKTLTDIRIENKEKLDNELDKTSQLVILHNKLFPLKK